MELVSTMLVEVPMVDQKSQWQSYLRKEIQTADTWQWWNRFRAFTDYNSKVKVALELTADLPSKIEILRWLGEPVSLLIIPVSIFVSNPHNYPVLATAHKAVVLKFLTKVNCKFAIKVSEDDRNIHNHVQYLRRLYQENSKLSDPMHG